MRYQIRHRGFRLRTPPSLLPLPLIFVLGCEGCPDRKPYTPYTITDKPSASSDAGSDAGPPSQESDSGSPDAPAVAPPFAPIPAKTADGDGSSWTFGEPALTVKAPAGRQFSLGLVIDADGDAVQDLIAWAKSPDGLRGELVFVAGREPAQIKTVFALPSDISAKGCDYRASLAQIGTRALAFDFGVNGPCASKQSASRFVAIIRFGKQGGDAQPKQPELAMEMRVASLPTGEQIAIAVETPDLDADGRDDIRARFTLSGTHKPFGGAVGPYPSVPNTSASIAFFDRPAGFSRDPSEPEASMGQNAASLMVSAKKKDSAPSVFSAAHQARRLHALLCAQRAHTAVSTSAGPVECGAARSLEDTAIAEAQAAFTLGDPIRAFAAVARFDGLPSPSDAHKRDMANLIARYAPKTKASLVHRAQALPRTFAPPSYAPLSFDAGGDLLIASEGAFMRVDRGTLAESQATLSLWPTQLVAGSSESGSASIVLKRVEQRCDAPALIGVFQEVQPGETSPDEKASEVLLPIATPVNAQGFPAFDRCAPAASIPVVPYGFSPELGLIFAVGSEVVAVKKQGASSVASLVKWPLPPPIEERPIPAGASRSPDGATVIVPSGRGFFVAAAGGSTKLWTGQDIEHAGPCVPSPGGARIACIADGKVVLLEGK